MMKMPKPPRSGLLPLIAFCSMNAELKADSYLSANLPASEFGYVDQYDPSITNKYNGEACVPTSQENSLVFLEDSRPAIGPALTGGTTYSNYLSTVLALGTCDYTNNSSGTYYVTGAIGLHNYLSNTAPTLIVNQSAYYSTNLYGSYGSVPNYITFQDTKANSIYTDLLSDNALYLGLTYTNSSGSITSGGHCILVDGIDWDSTLDTGTLSFIDPLDPGANAASTTGGYGNGIALSPVTTTGTLTLDPKNSNILMLSYRQYEAGYYANGVPPSADYSTVYTAIGFSEVLSVIPEPSTSAIMAVGIGSLIGYLRRRQERRI
jgi:hypothetical protein